MSQTGKRAMKGPLDGVRILDLTRATAGPYGSQMMGDLGAEIIKIETSEFALGVTSRQKLDSYLLYGDDIHFLSLNRNKKSLVLDLAKPDGKAVFHDLAKVSDVVYENFRPGVTKRLGIDYETLRKLNKKIIYCGLSGFGATGPYKNRPAFDVVIQAASGMMAQLGAHDADGRPTHFPLAIGDLMGGVYSSYGIIAALYEREKTGEGQFLDISMQDSMISLLSYVFAYRLNVGKHKDIMSRLLWGAFKTKDDYVVVCAHRQGFWENLCKTLGHEEWLTDPRFDSPAKRVENQSQIWAMIEEIFATKGRDEWVKILTDGDVPCAPLNTEEELINDPQVAIRKMIVKAKHVTGGDLTLIGNPIKMSAHPDDLLESPPLLGQHGKEICTGLLGYSEARYQELLDQKVTAPPKIPQK